MYNYSPDERAFMTTGEVAEKLGVSSDTLRYYEKLGLIRRVRRSGGKRHYVEQDYRLDRVYSAFESYWNAALADKEVLGSALFR